MLKSKKTGSKVECLSCALVVDLDLETFQRLWWLVFIESSVIISINASSAGRANFRQSMTFSGLSIFIMSIFASQLAASASYSGKRRRFRIAARNVDEADDLSALRRAGVSWMHLLCTPKEPFVLTICLYESALIAHHVNELYHENSVKESENDYTKRQ